MAIDPQAFSEEVTMPASEPGIEWEGLHPQCKKYLASRMKETLFENLGIDLNAEKPGVDKNGNQILYELTEEGEIADPLKDAPADSEKFLEKIRMGKIFAFPAGMEKPVQLKLNIENPTQADIKFSKPLEESLFPEPKKPNLWARFRHLFGGAKKEYAAYEKAMAQHRNGAAMDAQSKRKDILTEEAKAHQEEENKRKAEAAEAEARAKAEALKASRDQYHSKMDASVDLLEDVYGAQPKLREECLGCQYTSEQFAALQPHDLTQMNVNGPVSNKEFAGVSMLAALSPEIGGKVRSDPKLSPEENICSNNTFYTSDLYGWGDRGRANIGMYFKDAQAPARDKAAEAFKAYKEGNKKPLGELIGKGLHLSGTYMQRIGLKSSACVAVNGELGQAVNLLERDKDLMEIARNAGMTDKDLNVARADRKLLDICRANEWAEGRLAEAEQGKRELEADEKQACLEARLQYETLNTKLNLETQKWEKSEAHDEATAEGMSRFLPLMEEERALNQAQRENKMSMEEFLKQKQALRLKQESATAYLQTKLTLSKGVPELYEAIGKAEAQGKTAKALNYMVDQNLPGHAALNDLSAKELNEALKPEKLFDKDSPYMTAPEKPAEAANTVKQAEGPEVQQEKNEPQKEEGRYMDKNTFQERVETFSSPSL